jgi:hypothetical protein
VLWSFLGRWTRGRVLRELGGRFIRLDNVEVEIRVFDVLCNLKLGRCLNGMTKEITYLYREREQVTLHSPKLVSTIFLQAQRRVARHKPWHDPTFRLDLDPYLEK